MSKKQFFADNASKALYKITGSSPAKKDGAGGKDRRGSNRSRSRSISASSFAIWDEDRWEMICRTPAGVLPEEWITVNLIDFYNQANLLVGGMSEFCTASSCPRMLVRGPDGAPTHEFRLWKDGERMALSTSSVPAPAYMEEVLRWAEAQLNDASLFPPPPHASKLAFGERFAVDASTVFVRLYRLYGHLFTCHIAEMIEQKVQESVNACFLHFLAFVTQHGVIAHSELATIAWYLDVALDVQLERSDSGHGVILGGGSTVVPRGGGGGGGDGTPRSHRAGSSGSGGGGGRRSRGNSTGEEARKLRRAQSEGTPGAAGEFGAGGEAFAAGVRGGGGSSNDKKVRARSRSRDEQLDTPGSGRKDKESGGGSGSGKGGLFGGFRGRNKKGARDELHGSRIQPIATDANAQLALGQPTGTFGISLEHLLEIPRNVHGGGVPLFLKKCCDFLKARGGLKKEGLFRVSGSAAGITRLRAAFDNQPPEVDLFADDFESTSVHTVAGLIKLFFRELPEPILTYELHPLFVALADQPLTDESYLNLKELASILPASHFNTLKYLLRFLRKVAESSDVNQMTAQNIAICLSPSLMRSKDASVTAMFRDNDAQAKVLTIMIERYSDFFSSRNKQHEPSSN